VFLATGVVILLSLVSFHATDPSWSHATGKVATLNLIGPFGAHVSDALLQAFGFGAYLFPCLIFALGWKWIRSEATEAPVVKLIGSAMLVASACGVAALLPEWRVFDNTILPGGTAGYLLADALRDKLNFLGAAVILVTSAVISFFQRMRDRWLRHLERRQEAKLDRLERKREAAAARAAEREEKIAETTAAPGVPIVQTEDPAIASKSRRRAAPTPVSET